MKRWLILLLALALLVAFTVPAGAKLVFLALTRDGFHFIENRVLKKVGDCSIVATVFEYTRLQKTHYGMVKRVSNVVKVCCRAQTGQRLAYRYLGANFKPLHSVKVPPSRAKVFKPKPGTVAYKLVKKVCAPGFPK